MQRIFVALATAELLLLLGSAGLGLAGTEVSPDRHVLLAVLTLLLSCLIQASVFTYLSVSGKMISQAVHLARLPTDSLAQLKRLKASMTRQLALVVVTIVLVTATGASAWRGHGGSWFHLGAAVALLFAHAFVLWRQYGLVGAAGNLMEGTLRLYERSRAAAGAQKAAEGCRPEGQVARSCDTGVDEVG